MHSRRGREQGRISKLKCVNYILQSNMLIIYQLHNIGAILRTYNYDAAYSIIKMSICPLRVNNIVVWHGSRTVIESGSNNPRWYH